MDTRKKLKSRLKHQTVRRRISTIRRLFASTLAPYENFNEAKYARWLQLVDQKDGQVLCVYCGTKATQLDHLLGLVSKKEPTGFGHFMFNSVPACNVCNEKKGKTWLEWLQKRHDSDQAEIDQRSQIISKFIAELEKEPKYDWSLVAEERNQFEKIWQQVERLVDKADIVARKIHELYKVGKK